MLLSGDSSTTLGLLGSTVRWYLTRTRSSKRPLRRAIEPLTEGVSTEIRGEVLIVSGAGALALGRVVPGVVAAAPAAPESALSKASSEISVQRTEFGVDLGGANSIDGSFARPSNVLCDTRSSCARMAASISGT